MGKSGGSGDGAVHFSPYLEVNHWNLLNRGWSAPITSLVDCLNKAWLNNPYEDYVPIDANTGFLGVGYVIGQFPSLFDMFGKFMAGLDIEVLWSQIYNETVRGTETAAAVTEHSKMLQDDIDTKVLPKFLAGCRDVNAVMSSAFVAGKAIIYDAKVKSVSQFAASLQIHMVDVAQARWGAHLDWNKAVTATYGDLMKLYYSAKFDSEGREMEFKVKKALWDLSLFDYARSMLGALTGTPAAKISAEPSQGAKSIAMAASGAGAGAMIGQSISAAGGGNYAGWGAAAGGVLGLAASFI